MRDRTSKAGFLLLWVGVVACSGVSRAEEPLPDGRWGMRTAPLLLLSRGDVRKELGLDEKQTSEAEQEIVALYAKAAALKGKSGADVVAARHRIDTEQQHWLKSHLTEVQYGRLHQIDLQWEGASALISRPVIAARLALTKPQVEALHHAVAKRKREREAGAEAHAVEAELERTAGAILNETQREQWKTLLGPPFKLQIAGRPSASATR